MNADDRLELFFSQSLDGFFFMMIDEPIRWDDSIDKERALDYVFEHQRVTKVNDAMLAQYGATRESFLGTTPKDLFRHDLPTGVRLNYVERGDPKGSPVLEGARPGLAGRAPAMRAPGTARTGKSRSASRTN